ncbi:DNA internalization-related competence protein ComEC/Rec2 [bacterium]|nr:MAG: DNA internalization-related competence protein ComEC/Rec2 [bacterium]
MIGLAVSFICGIAGFHFFPFFPLSITALGIVTILFLLRKNQKKILVIFIFFVLGFFYSAFRQERVQAIEFPDYEIIVEGTVIDVPERYEDRIRLTIDSVRLNSRETEGKIRLFLFNTSLQGPSLVPGDRVQTVSRLRAPGTFRNPGVFSYDLRKDGIIAIGYTQHMQINHREDGFSYQLNKKRQDLGRIIRTSLSPENASLYKAIIAGLKTGITPELRDVFSATGLAHLLSISGTHFGLLAFIIFTLIKAVMKMLPARVLTKVTLYMTPTQTAVLLTLPVLIMYALISGSRTPTIRALIMVFIFMLALFLGRKGQWLNSLSIAALIILLWQPAALFELSFQLSFLAVLSIGHVLEKQSKDKNQNSLSSVQEHSTEYLRILKTATGKIKTGVMITIAAVLGTAPVVILVFKQFPLISPVTNLILTPYICFILLPIGFLSSFTALFFNMTVMPFSGLIDSVATGALYLVKAFSRIPYSNLHVHNPSFFIIAAYFLSMMVLIKGRTKWKFLPVCLVLTLYIMTPFLIRDKHLSITFLDIGQGEASVVRLPDKKVLLIDGGTEKPDMGRLVIAPFLWSQGIGKVDFLIVSHPHPDHYGGLLYIMDNFTVGEVWLNGRAPSEADQLFQKILDMNLPLRVLRRGDLFESTDYRIYVFHPYDEFYADSPRGEFSNINSGSLVLKLESDDFSVLFTGDIEREAEKNLSSLGNWLESTILKVPHHGGRTSSSQELLENVKPKIAVISAGRDNRFHHPHRETVERYSNIGTGVFRTDRDGAITVTVKNNPHQQYEIETFQDSSFKRVKGFRDELRNLKLLLMNN